MPKQPEKTNVMRVLEQHKIPYAPHTYPVGDAAPDGVSVARMMGQDPDRVFKTLVARGASGGPEARPGGTMSSISRWRRPWT